jgi:bifunctional NMN adenylyltransferase/nudix hydrolase
MRTETVATIIGRFEPVHTHHVQDLLYPTLTDPHNDLVVLILGSSLKARDYKDPFTWQERETMIRLALGYVQEQEGGMPDNWQEKLVCVPARDSIYSDSQWLMQVQNLVHKAVEDRFGKLQDYRVILNGSDKDDTTYYLSKFPQWGKNVKDVRGEAINSTDVRESLFLGNDYWKDCVYPPVKEYIDQWFSSDAGQRILEEYLFTLKYKKGLPPANDEDVAKVAFAVLDGLNISQDDTTFNTVFDIIKSECMYPYPIVYQTVDNVVFYKGNVLLIRRKHAPGKGLWALPGGFIESKEFLIDSSIRECEEETELVIKPEWHKWTHTFDSPSRSLRRRTITTAFSWVVPERFDEVRVMAADDADKAKWFPLNKVLEEMSDKLFEDHHDIISYMVNRLEY